MAMNETPTSVRAVPGDASWLTPEHVRWFAESVDSLTSAIELAIRGKRDQIRLAIGCMVAGGHLLIEDVPGVGKTSLARALTAALGLNWGRIQFTPDLLPSDVTGVSVYNQSSNRFEYRPGPVFVHVLLADEINRASPKTQSALLEVMEEGQVTVDGMTHTVPHPFMVVATQNPIELEGTYRLPEAQLDRFFMRIGVGYPDRAAEIDIMRSQRAGSLIGEIKPLGSSEEVAQWIQIATAVHIDTEVYGYIADIAGATRQASDLRIGASPRASLALARAARVQAAMSGRTYVSPDDVKAIAAAVLNHRLLLSPDAELRGKRVEKVVVDLLKQVQVPQWSQPAR